MDKFSEAYQKASDVVSGQKFEAAWDKLFKSPQFTQLLAADGPEEMQAAALDVLRKELSKDTKHGRIVASVMGGGVGDAIVAAATNKTSPGSLADRAATIKFLKHLYLAGKHGSQQVWCYAGTKSYGQWVFDEVQGTEGTIKSKVSHETEVYDAGVRKGLAESLLLAKAWTQRAIVELGNNSDTTKQMIRDWFTGASGSAQDVEMARTTLMAGLRKIEAVCASGKLVFSDHPPDRTSGGWKDWAFVYKSEAMNVVYMQGAAVKAAKRVNLQWKAALTIIHELSHREVRTDDNRYDYDGLAPDTVFPPAKALNNADSWAYFVVDLVGMLPAGDRTDVLY